MAVVDIETIKHIAKLANLNLTEEELKSYTGDMQEILEMANTINNVNTEDVNETIGANSKFNEFRKDEIKSFGDREILLKNAPSQDEGMFRIPKVIN